MTLLAGLLLLILAAVNACLLVQARAHERRIDRLLTLGQTERATPNPDMAALIALTENLCQRIQAPEQAVIDHALTVTPVGPQPMVPLPDDDEAFWASRESKDELANRLMGEELAA